MTKVLLWPVLAAAGILRFYGLTRESLWNDELASIDLARGGPWDGEFWRRLIADVHPPGYELFLAGWIGAFGDSEASVRSSSAVLGVLGVYATFALGRRLFGEFAGVLAAWFAAVSPFLIAYSREVRSYSANYLLSALTAVTLLSLLEGRPGVAQYRTRILLSGLCIAATAYAHYMGLVLVVGLLGLFGAMAGRQHLSKLLSAYGVAFVLYLPWVFVGLWADLQAGGLTWLKAPTLDELLAFPLAVMPAFVYVCWAFIAVVGSAEPPDANESRPVVRHAGFLCIGWSVGFVLAAYLKSTHGQPVFLPRNLAGGLPPLFAVGGAVCAAGARRVRWPAAVLSLALGATVIWYIAVPGDVYGRRRKEPFRETTQKAVAVLAAIPQLKVFGMSYGAGWYFDYYLGQLGSSRRIDAGGSTVVDLERWLGSALSAPEARALVLVGHVMLKPAELRRLRSRYKVHVLRAPERKTALYLVTLLP